MNGIDLRNFLYLNKISQDDAAKLIGVKRQTINNWCNKGKLSGKILTKAKYLMEYYSAEKTSKTSESNSQDIISSGGVIVGRDNNGHINNHNHDIDTENIEVLKAQVLSLTERIREKDAQLREKDAQINKLLDLLSGK